MREFQYTSEERAIAERFHHDARWKALQYGLNQLTLDQLRRIMDHISSGGSMVYDSYNYDEERGLWCPLAVGLDVPRWVENCDDPVTMTNERAKHVIVTIGRKWRKDFSLNPLSGISGQFFTRDRAVDVALLCRVLIGERESNLATWTAQQSDEPDDGFTAGYRKR